MFLQFLPFSSTPYAQTVQPPETGETGEDVEVNPSASLNEWLVPGFPNSQELEVTNISKFVSCIRLLFKKVLSDNFSGCYLRLFKLLSYCYSFASLASPVCCYFFNISNCFFVCFC
jgi:hypothetical protein